METGESKEDLVHCIYSSVATIEFSQDDIVTLLGKARSNNSKMGVTGMLLYDRGSFFQVLEGKSDVVESLLETIQEDKRHDRVIRIIYEEIEERDFSEWTMGYSGVSREDLKNLEGLNDFFRSTKLFIDLDEGKAKMLLRGFKEGKWRASIK